VANRGALLTFVAAICDSRYLRLYDEFAEERRSSGQVGEFGWLTAAADHVTDI